jgi:regulator of sirC expression with transglutaminase-like and TPR domain
LTVDALRRFSVIVAAGRPQLDESLALIASHAGKGVDTGELLSRLDALAEGCQARDPGGLCAELFAAEGFRGATDDYHDPRNSLLDQVLARRRGIPITLSILAMEVGRRLGIEFVGIGMPGHFIVRDAHRPDAFFDPFRLGAPLDRTACQAIFERLQGPAAVFDPSYLEPTAPLAVVHRVLANLHHAYALAGDRRGLLRVLQLRAEMPGAGPVEFGVMAELLAASGRFDEAAVLHERMADADPAGSAEHANRATRLRARLN